MSSRPRGRDKCLWAHNKNQVCTALGRVDLGRTDLSRGGTTFPISGNHFPISVILLISWYREIISWYREIISRYRKMRFISRYRELFPDIGKLNSRYQKIIPYFPISEIRIPDIGKSFPDIGNSNSRYQEIISDIGKWWIKTQMAFHTEESKHCYNMVPPTAWLPSFVGLHNGNKL